MRYMDELDSVWNHAEKHNMCECKSDKEWGQSYYGEIFCSGCQANKK